MESEGRDCYCIRQDLRQGKIGNAYLLTHHYKNSATWWWRTLLTGSKDRMVSESVRVGGLMRLHVFLCLSACVSTYERTDCDLRAEALCGDFMQFWDIRIAALRRWWETLFQLYFFGVPVLWIYFLWSHKRTKTKGKQTKTNKDKDKQK